MLGPDRVLQRQRGRQTGVGVATRFGRRSSYLSLSGLVLTFGLAKRDKVDRVGIAWPSGRVEEFKDLAAGRLRECTEGNGVRYTGRF